MFCEEDLLSPGNCEVDLKDPIMATEESLLLKVEGLGKQFGGVRALEGYDLTLKEGELMGLIGPNGAGKTTVFNLMTGVLRPSKGRIIFRGKDITGFKPDRNAALGMARTFQNIRLFNGLRVIDNVKVGDSYAPWGGAMGDDPESSHFEAFRDGHREARPGDPEHLWPYGLQG